MAVCTLAVGTADTGITPNTSGAFTPAANDLLIVLVTASGTIEDSATLTSSAGLTFTQFLAQPWNSNASRLYGFVAEALAAASSQDVTADTPSDPATGTNIFVYRVSGMTRTGLSAILQSAGANGSSGTTPAATFAASALTANPTLGVLSNLVNPATVTEPSGWTEPAGGDIGYNAPANGGETVFRDSGFTGTTITWGSGAGSTWGVLIVELDTTVYGIGARSARVQDQPMIRGPM